MDARFQLAPHTGIRCVTLPRPRLSRLLFATLPAMLLAAAPARAQIGRLKATDRTGPRLGITYVFPGDDVDRLKKRLAFDDNIAGAVLSQFGWQFEHRIFEQRSGLMGLNKFFFLVGGLDQAALVPSVSWLIGLRMPYGLELGAGPSVLPVQLLDSINDGELGQDADHKIDGLGFVVAGGWTFRSGDVTFPVDLALVRSRGSYHVSVLWGFGREEPDREPVAKPDSSAPEGATAAQQRAEQAHDRLEAEAGVAPEPDEAPPDP